MFFHFWQVLTVILAAIAFALALAHVCELPGKLRLSKDTYTAMQAIYYPGFTIGGGVGEAGGMLAMIILLILTPFGTVRFWLTLVALLGLIAMQLVFWVVTQPVNRFWLQSEKLSAAGSAFFGVRETQSRGAAASAAANWTDYRDRWEYSHVARAVFAFVSLLALVIAVSRGG